MDFPKLAKCTVILNELKHKKNIYCTDYSDIKQWVKKYKIVPDIKQKMQSDFISEGEQKNNAYVFIYSML